MDQKPKNQYGDGRDALLHATVRIVADKGLRGMTFRAVAHAAGVNNALIAHHFGNREGLLIAALEFTKDIAISESGLMSAVDHFSDFESALSLTTLTRRKLLTFQYEMIIEASRNEQFKAPVSELYRGYFSALMPENSTESAPFTRAKFATLDGLVLQMISGAITQDEFYESMQAMTDWIKQPTHPKTRTEPQEAASPDL